VSLPLPDDIPFIGSCCIKRSPDEEKIRQKQQADDKLYYEMRGLAAGPDVWDHASVVGSGVAALHRQKDACFTPDLVMAANLVEFWRKQGKIYGDEAPDSRGVIGSAFLN
jgi:hypothetical protein